MTSIFIEGKESGFLQQLITHIKKNDSLESISFESINGWQGLKNVDNKLLDNHLQGFKNIIILDADTESNGGGYSKRKKEIEEILQKIGIDYNLFLFPNNKDDGDYETMLESIINPKHKGLIECFEKYETCIEQYKKEDNTPKYKTPNRKSKIYSYITAFPLSKKQKEKVKNKDFWFFDNSEYWSLDSDYLKNLKDFLLEVL